MKSKWTYWFVLLGSVGLFMGYGHVGMARGAVPRVSGGSFHTVALKPGGTLWAWGYNGYGQLGNNSTTDSAVPVEVYGGGSNWVTVAAGGNHTAALKSDGTLWAWGYNGAGQLGDGSWTNSAVPVEVCGGGTNWVAVAAGWEYTVALKSDGTLWSWGANAYGQLGNNSAAFSAVPVEVYGGGTNWAAVAAGQYHTVALKSDGTLWSWGSNQSGQLGNNSTADSHIPVQVYGGGTDWVAAAAGFFYTVALKSDGTLWTWGSNYCGQLGNNSTADSHIPVQVYGGGTDWAAVAAGGWQTVGLKSDGTLRAWGSNYYGQLGNDSATDSAVPVGVYGGGTDWAAVAAGGRHTMALKSDGTLWAWGSNYYGQLGNDSATDSAVPVEVYGGGTGWVAVFVSKDPLSAGHNPCYSAIQDGIDSASVPLVVNITQETYHENISVDFDRIITLRGGWDLTFTTLSSYTVIQGSMTISKGKLIIDNIILR